MTTSYLQGITHVNLTIELGPEAFEAAQYFYIEVLGLERLSRPENLRKVSPGLWLRCGSQQVHISAEQNATQFNLNSGRHAAFEVKDLDALHTRLEQEGNSFESADQFEGQRRFFWRDQWGNLLEFVQFI
jgi:catechol 2,3-dioxygenase-like lactoylglutathione lyase family enzyme